MTSAEDCSPLPSYRTRGKAAAMEAVLTLPHQNESAKETASGVAVGCSHSLATQFRLQE